MIIDNWQGCYREGWKGIITDESFAHPAKVAYSLAERIYQHLAEECWIWPGATVIDPFGGIGGFALHAMLKGCHFTGCELEKRFVLLARKNIARWSRKYRNLPGVGSAIMLYGDSLKLTDSPANLGAMKAGEVAAMVGSPPWESSLARGGGSRMLEDLARKGRMPSASGANATYGTTANNLGNSTGNTFWSASNDIVRQCYGLLGPGGHAIWVVKSFVREGKIVDFPGQWRTLCESVGFVTLHEHHAMLVEETEYDTLFNGREITKKERKSFFRRLHEKKHPATAINYEVVVCMEKPRPEAGPAPASATITGG